MMKTRLKKIAACSILLATNYYAMEKNDMVPIKTYSDVAPFAGHITAYKTNNDLFGRYKGFIKYDPDVKYAYISKDSFELYQLLKIEEVSLFDKTYNDIYLTTINLKNSCLYMRKIDSYELIYILDALKLNKAQFADINFFKNELKQYMQTTGAKLLQPDKKNSKAKL